ncbi:MAG: site-2 protease family protein [Polyangiaceae bacterium]|nr:site-2 protease family protein [Polyangiaceae bacterium]
MSASPPSGGDPPSFPPVDPALVPRWDAPRGAPIEAHEERPTLEPEAPVPPRWGVHAVLFVLTVLSVFLTGLAHAGAYGAPALAGGTRELLFGLWRGWQFAVPLLAILVSHELGHFVAAKIHRVPASLPYFIPLPFLSPFGTAGAIIAMRGRIRSRDALLDIGAAGPIAGMVVALPVLWVGLSLSPVEPLGGGVYVQEGQSLLYWALKRATVGPIPAGHDVMLHPTALAGWAGLLVTMINLVPWGQLDGGHVAYALFGTAQDRYARWVRPALLGLFAMNLVVLGVPVLQGRGTMTPSRVVENSLFWLMWFAMLTLMQRVGGAAHPPTEPGELSPVRRRVAIGCLVGFVALFMPTPMALRGLPELERWPAFPPVGASVRPAP